MEKWERGLRENGWSGRASLRWWHFDWTRNNIQKVCPKKSLRRKRHLEINGILVGKRKMNREEKMNLWSFHSRSEPHMHREDTATSSLPIPLRVLGTLLFLPTHQWNPVWFGKWHSHCLFFAELCEIRHLVNQHRGAGKRVFARTTQNSPCKQLPRDHLSVPWK